MSIDSFSPETEKGERDVRNSPSKFEGKVEVKKLTVDLVSVVKKNPLLDKELMMQGTERKNPHPL